MSLKIYIPDDLITCVSWGKLDGGTTKNWAARFTCVFADGDSDTPWHESTGWLYNEQKGLTQPKVRGNFYRYSDAVLAAIEQRCKELPVIQRILADGPD